MRKLSIILISVFITSSLFAYNPKKTDVEYMYKDVGKILGHKVETYEQNIIDTTYFYYFTKNNNQWTKEVWNDAVNKSVDLCNNNAAVAAAKASDFGEKLLQSLVVTADDAISGFNNWLNRKSEEYKKRY